MELTPSNLDFLFYGFDTRFQKGYEIAKVYYPRFAMEIPSSTRENHYGWLGKIPQVREWLGERVFNNITAYSYAIINKDYEITLEVPRNDILDDQVGLYGPLSEMNGAAMKQWPDNLMTQLLRNGQTTLCFDGQNFFDANHPVAPADPTQGVYSNYFTGMPLTAANYTTVRQAMMSYLGEDGNPMGVMPDLIVVPPQLENIARTILHADLIAQSVPGNGTTAVTNTLKGSAEILVDPRLAADPTTWYLLDTTRPIKPFIFQLRQAPVFVSMTSPDDGNVFNRKVFVWGADSRGNAGYTLPFLAAKAVG
jgi:phage major head subunit gpT-like protein